MPTFELTTVRFFEPFSRTARSSASGTPESPNPPTSSDEPSTTSSTASAGVARTFELIMRDRGASEVERRAVRRMSVERIVACRTALGEGATAISDPCARSNLGENRQLLFAEIAEVLLPSEPALRAVRSAQARRRLKQEAYAGLLEGERAWLNRLVFIDECGAAINTHTNEWHEQILALQHVQPHHRVLELGARYGTVSCALQYNRPARHVAVEPDARVWAALAANLAANDGCEKCEVFEGFARAGRSSSASSTPPLATARAHRPPRPPTRRRRAARLKTSSASQTARASRSPR